MKKIFFIILAVCLLLGITGCTKSLSERNESYTIPKVTELYVPDDFPDLSAGTLKEYNWSYYAFRVVEVKEDMTYLACVTSIKAAYVIYGNINDTNYQKGDFIKIDVSRHYTDTDNPEFYAAYSDDITKTEKLTLQEAEDIIKGMRAAEKPVIYLYPTKETDVKVDLVLKGELTCTYPEYKNGWTVKAMPDGTLYNKEGNEYYCLYWEADINIKPDFSKGFCIRGIDTADFLKDKLLSIGLTQREANEFIIYWLPIMQNNEYNVISFQTDNYEQAARLLVEPKPESVLRVYMAFYESDKYIELEPQSFKPFTRKGFTVVEWGGSEVKY